MVSRLILNLRDPKLSSGRHWMSTTIADYPVMTSLDPQYTSIQPTTRTFSQGEAGMLQVDALPSEDEENYSKWTE